jgi:mRNA-degrading endonuclease toxin of MazEF toxin-antitoxin module
MSEADHRPWLILSKREAVALRNAVVVGPAPSQDLVRALRQITLQLEWIERGYGHEPEVAAALERQRA